MKFWRHTNWPPCSPGRPLQLRGPGAFVSATEQVHGPLGGFITAPVLECQRMASSLNCTNGQICEGRISSGPDFFSVYSASLWTLCRIWVLKIVRVSE